MLVNRIYEDLYRAMDENNIPNVTRLRNLTKDIVSEYKTAALFLGTRSAVDKQFIAIMERLGYDVEVVYHKRADHIAPLVAKPMREPMPAPEWVDRSREKAKDDEQHEQPEQAEQDNTQNGIA